MENKAMIYDGETGLREVCYGDDSYEFLSQSVGGWIELLPTSTFGDDIDVFINEEGKFKCLAPSAVLVYQGKIHDYVMGKLVFVSHNDEGDTIPLTDEQIAKIRDIFDSSTYYIDMRNGLLLPELSY